MKPGRELDAFVAEKVMGWSDLNTELIIETGWDLYGINPDGEGEFLVPEYSTDIDAAWEIVKKCIEEGHYFNLAYYQKYNGMDGPPYDSHWSCYAFGVQKVQSTESAAHAICLAALKAINTLDQTEA